MKNSADSAAPFHGRRIEQSMTATAATTKKKLPRKKKSRKKPTSRKTILTERILIYYNNKPERFEYAQPVMLDRLSSIVALRITHPRF